jgi:hypothetical protein
MCSRSANLRTITADLCSRSQGTERAPISEVDIIQGGTMKISAVIAAGCLSMALGAWTSAAVQQTSPQAPVTTGSSQVGSGTGVNTDPGTQRTTDRAGQTPRPAGTNPGTPSGSLGGDQNTSGGTRGTTGGTAEKGGSTRGSGAASTRQDQSAQGSNKRGSDANTRPTKKSGKSGSRTRHTHPSGATNSRNTRGTSGASGK